MRRWSEVDGVGESGAGEEEGKEEEERAVWWLPLTSPAVEGVKSCIVTASFQAATACGEEEEEETALSDSCDFPTTVIGLLVQPETWSAFSE